MHSLARIVKFALQDICRNFSLSFMTVFILILMLLSVNILWSVDVLTREAVQLVKEQINVSIYFVPGITDGELGEIEEYLAAFPEVVDLQILSREQVLEVFHNRHRMSKEMMEALKELGGNPFGPTMVVKTREPADYKDIIMALEVPEYENLIEAKSFDQHEDAIERIHRITSRVENVGFGLSVLFAVIAFLIIFNTIRVAIYTQWSEISIKRLVGASNWFIRGPYLVEAALFTVLSVAATVGLVYLSLKWLDPYLAIAFPNGFSLTNYYNSHSLYLFGLQAAAVLALTVISSSLAMRRQLKV